MKCRCWQEHPLVILLLYFSCYTHFWSELSFCSFISMEIKMIFFSNIWRLLSVSVEKSILSFCGFILSFWAFVASFRWKLRHQVPSWLLKGAPLHLMPSCSTQNMIFPKDIMILSSIINILYLNMTFQVTCVGQLSQFLRCFVQNGSDIGSWWEAVLWCKISVETFNYFKVWCSSIYIYSIFIIVI